MKWSFNAGCVLVSMIIAGYYPVRSFAQDHKNTTVKIAANTDYEKAGKFKRMLLGDHYRREWATAVEIQVIDLDTTAGGLTALKLGGGMQTKSLRLKGADGKEYVLRSVNKDPSKALPPEMVGTFANDVLQDQISSSNPYAPLAVASLAASAGILHTTPQMVYVPYSARLGAFEKEFAETVCLFEERPSDEDEDNPVFGSAKHIVNSEKLFEKIRSDNDHCVDEKAFLKARLFDMWIGDWDRHDDQWLWAGFKAEGKTIYQPIPRDRDQAFSKLDGMIPALAARKWAVRKTQNFDYSIRDIDGLNMAGHFLDVHFTTRLSLQDWIETCHELQSRLTDAAIDSAFSKMPPAIFAISGQAIIAKLKTRRNDLEQYAVHYYRFLAKEVNVAGTGKQEIFEVNRLNDDSTRVLIYKTNKAGQKGDIVFKKVFLRSETKEIRLYSLGGDDRFNISGNTNKGMLIRVIRGKGEDIIADSSNRKAKIYDDSYNVFNDGTETKSNTDTLKNRYTRKSFRYDWLGPKQSPGYNPDDGIYIGGGFTFRKQQFGKSPYGYSQSVWGNYAFATGAYNFWYEGIFTQAVAKWDLHLNGRINAPNYVRNYYGLGNETKKTVTTKNYYNIRSNQEMVTPSLYRRFGNHHALEGGIAYQSIKMERSEGRFISDVDSKLDSSDFGRKNYLSPFLNYEYSTVDNVLYPRKGLKIGAGINYVQNLEQSKNFFRLTAESSFFLSSGSWTAAVRTGVATILNDDYEFFQANTLGGTANLRGYRRDRFAGKTSLYNNTEIRYRFNYLRGYVFRGQYGLLSFFDNGRVWMPDETSHTWHYSYGGGIWFLPYNKIAFTATYGISKEDRILVIKAGFLF